MSTASELYERLALPMGITASALEPYGTALRKQGHWPATKPGRGATPISVKGATSLILASMFPGAAHISMPDDIMGGTVFLNYANLEMMPSTAQMPAVAAVASHLNLNGERRFGIWLDAILGLYVRDEIETLIAPLHNPDAYVEEWQYLGPLLKVAIQMPFPIGSISFRAADNILGDSLSEASSVLIPFLSPVYSWAQGSLGEEVKGNFETIIDQLQRKTGFAKKTTIEIDGQVFDSVADAFRDSS